MNDELALRQRAISLRLAGRSVNYICAALGLVRRRRAAQLRAGRNPQQRRAYAQRYKAFRLWPKGKRSTVRVSKSPVFTFGPKSPFVGRDIAR